MSAYNKSDESGNHLFDKDAWGVATIGLLFTSIAVSILLGIFFQSGLGKFADGFSGFLFSIFLIIIGALISFLLIKFLKIIPVFFKVTVCAVLLSLLVFIQVRDDLHPSFLFFTVFLLIVLQGILAGLIWVILSGRLRFVLYSIRIWARIIVLGIILLDIGVYYLLAASDQEDNVVFSPKLDKKIIEGFPNEKIIADSFRISSFYYGSGNDQQRSTYNQGLSFNAKSFDIGKILPESAAYFDKKFKWFWGFDSNEIPLNAQVWIPEADSLQSELVIIIHGDEAETSDLENGFGYIAEALSSMGYMVVIPDLNYFNSLWLDMPQDEKLHAKTIVLQKHLAALHQWNSDSTHRLFNSLDSSRVATIIGHGEGASLARELINLSKVDRIPYNANYTANTHFNFKHIIELAPRKVRSQQIQSIENISHLAILSGYDAVNILESYLPMVHFTDTSQYYFSNTISIYKANYSQFNEALEGRDLRPPYNWLINQSAIMSGKEQRKLTVDLIAVMLKCTSGKMQWLPIMHNTHYLSELEENTVILNQFKDNKQTLLATFDEDINPLTTTFDSAEIESKNFKIWSEIDYQSVPFYDNKGILLGWDATKFKNLSKAMQKDSTASFSVLLAPAFNESLQLTLDATFNFSMAYFGDDVEHVGLFSNVTNSLDNELDFSIELVDSIGIVNRIAFKHFAAAISPQKPLLFKIPWLNNKRGQLFLQSYSLPMKRFFAMNPDFNMNTIAKINFVFDKSEKGKIILDNIGFTKSRPQSINNEEKLLELSR